MSSGRSFRLLLLISNHCKLDIRSTQIGIEWNLFADRSTTVTCFRLLSQKEVVLYFSYILQIQEDISFIILICLKALRKIRIALFFLLNFLPALSLSHHFIGKRISEITTSQSVYQLANPVMVLNQIFILNKPIVSDDTKTGTRQLLASFLGYI